MVHLAFNAVGPSVPIIGGNCFARGFDVEVFLDINADAARRGVRVRRWFG
ncbi:hypothetical protein [Poriferisphaera sp. WC338]